MDAGGERAVQPAARSPSVGDDGRRPPPRPPGRVVHPDRAAHVGPGGEVHPGRIDKDAHEALIGRVETKPVRGAASTGWGSRRRKAATLHVEHPLASAPQASRAPSAARPLEVASAVASGIGVGAELAAALQHDPPHPLARRGARGRSGPAPRPVPPRAVRAPSARSTRPRQLGAAQGQANQLVPAGLDLEEPRVGHRSRGKSARIDSVRRQANVGPKHIAARLGQQRAERVLRALSATSGRSHGQAAAS